MSHTQRTGRGRGCRGSAGLCRKEEQGREKARKEQGRPQDFREGRRVGCKERKVSFKKHCCAVRIGSPLTQIQGVHTVVILPLSPKGD